MLVQTFNINRRVMLSKTGLPLLNRRFCYFKLFRYLYIQIFGNYIYLNPLRLYSCKMILCCLYNTIKPTTKLNRGLEKNSGTYNLIWYQSICFWLNRFSIDSMTDSSSSSFTTSYMLTINLNSSNYLL